MPAEKAAGKRLANFLGGFNGHLVTDGYAVPGNPLRVLDPCQTEVAGYHAGRRYRQNQQGGCGLPVLQ